MGVVYGDIGTSPLYALRECFNPKHGVPVSPENILGILSLIFWSLTLVVTVKYLIVVMSADNQGEGGILALMARILSREPNGRKTRISRNTILIMGLCGAALLCADGMITPAISVLSAVEGLEVATPLFRPAVIPITLGILVSLALVQKRGTAGIGRIFGPIMMLWFLTISVMGLRWVIHCPTVLHAINPTYAIHFFHHHHWHGVIVLGAVVLCITGCEALYADMGHFGRRPISFAWILFVFPAVMLNYFGQGALLMDQGALAANSPFYNLVSGLWLYPVVLIATIATVIASQALISGMFSLAQQAIQLDYCPRMTIVHTSSRVHGQIYIPEINTLLSIACCLLVIGFRTSSGLAAAYGIAVIGTMITTTLLMFAIQYEQWRWPLWQAGLVTVIFIGIDASFLVGNIVKIFHGGWFPLVAGGALLLLLITWNRGLRYIRKFDLKGALHIHDFVKPDMLRSIPRVKGTALFLMSYTGVIPRVLLHHLKHNKVLHEQVILLNVLTEGIPFVPRQRRVNLENLGEGFHLITVHCGFMEHVDMPEVLTLAKEAGLTTRPEISYFIGHVTLKTSGTTRLSKWQKSLFSALFHTEKAPALLLGVPPNRVVELGEQTEI